MPDPVACSDAPTAGFARRSTRVGRLLARGLTQRASAGRMGLSERAVAGHVARLRELCDAEALFRSGRLLRGSRTGESGG
ncbi:hypothetical protein [Kitasatospora sp. NPDC057738]|uniref:hypothetical protein n=1 Tax=Kitasatospora sp. NPDC057738 TaxID=3346233 RepID=UPI00367A2D00